MPFIVSPYFEPAFPRFPLFNLSSSCSASLTSSSVKLPDSIRWATTGWLLPPKKARLVYQAALSRRARDDRLEDVGVADLLRAADRALLLEPVHHRLDGGVGRPALVGKGLLDLTHGRHTAGPERVHDLQLELAQFRQSHGIS
jgi:hypothetical protein